VSGALGLPARQETAHPILAVTPLKNNRHTPKHEKMKARNCHGDFRAFIFFVLL
jgi:hypothetical protein